MATARKTSKQSPLSNSGIQTLPTGHSVIPSSVRSDGSTRKEIKVRPGYKPPEDQEKYQNRVVAVRNEIGMRGVPGAEPVNLSGSPGGDKNKNAKRREAARRKAASTGAITTEGEQGEEENHQADDAYLVDVTDQISDLHLKSTNDTNTAKPQEACSDLGKPTTNHHHRSNDSKESTTKFTPAPVAPEPKTSSSPTFAVDTNVDHDKKARNLKKKLRQARDLKDKKDGGGQLLPEQLAKVTKIHELIRDLDRLGYDADGEPKTKADADDKDLNGNLVVAG